VRKNRDYRQREEIIDTLQNTLQSYARAYADVIRDAFFLLRNDLLNARLAYDPFRSVSEAISIKSKRFRDRRPDTPDTRTREISRLIIIAAHERMERGSDSVPHMHWHTIWR